MPEYQPPEVPGEHPVSSPRLSPMTVWVVAEHRFEWYEIKHICATCESAIAKWEELRDTLIDDNLEMIEHCNREGHDASHWDSAATALQQMAPGDTLDQCDYPDLQEWVLE